MENIWFLDKKEDKGPFDIIGDVHGCYTELTILLDKLGWVKDHHGLYSHPFGRKLCFVGDLVDRGNDSPSVVRLVMGLIKNNQAYWVKGNHDDKWARYLKGNKVKISHGIIETIEQFKKEPDAFTQEVGTFIDDLPIYAILDEGRLIVAHAGLEEKLHYQKGNRAKTFALYGQPTGKYDQNGYPIRYPWQNDYKGKATIVYGHVALDAVQQINNCIDIDTSCVFGGMLTALRWPEMEYMHVQSQTDWSEHPIK